MQASLTVARSVVSKLFGPYLLPTNIVSGIGLAYLGDIAKQRVLISRQGGTDNDKKKLVHDEALKMGLASVPLSVEMHFWYKFLDRKFPSKSKSHVLKKVLLDEAFMAPILTFTLIGASTLLERKGWDEFVFRLKHSFGLLFLADVAFYAPVQCLNFYFFPTHYRTVVVYAASVLYFSVASYAVHEFASKYRKKSSDDSKD